jgi:hypothetical protein
MLALTCDVQGCRKLAVVWFTDGTAECKDHKTVVGTTENDFGIPQHNLGFIMDYDDHDKYVGTIPRLPMLADST